MPETLVQKLMKRACITLDENSSIKLFWIVRLFF